MKWYQYLLQDPNIDWNMPNEQLRVELGLTRQQFHRLIRLRTSPSAESLNRKAEWEASRKASREAEREQRLNHWINSKDVNWESSIHLIRKQTHLPYLDIRFIRQKLGILNRVRTRLNDLEAENRLNQWLKADVDWTKSLKELAVETGLPIPQIARIRLKLGIKVQRGFKSKYSGQNIAESWDWSQKDATLAKEAGLSRERIRQIRNLLGKPKIPRTLIERYNLKSREYDWTKPDTQLSREHGLSLNMISKLRKQIGTPRPRNMTTLLKPEDVTIPTRELMARYGMKSFHSAENLRVKVLREHGCFDKLRKAGVIGRPHWKQLAWLNEDMTQPSDILAKKFGVSKEVVNHFKYRFGFKPKGIPRNTKPKPLEFYAGLDWTRKRKELADECGVSLGTISNIKMSLMKKGMISEEVNWKKTVNFYASLDWSKPISELSRETGLPCLRLRSGLARLRKFRRTQANLNHVVQPTS
jgi:hypothetical protein